MEYLIQIKEAIEAADLVVVGLGEEWNVSKETQTSIAYGRIISDLKAHSQYQWLLPYFYEKLTDEKLLRASEQLFSLLRDKNYFVVSTAINPAFLSFAKADKVVMPCGSALQMRDEALSLREGYPEFLASLDAYLREELTIEEIAFVRDSQGEIIPFNNIFAPQYKEEGYLSQWDVYMKWLQGTLNRRTCLLELGAGLQFPSVFRFPFEKMTYFNQKARCFRVHSSLYHLAEEMAVRSTSVPMHAVELFAQEV